MKALEDAERARMELEDEYARVRADLLEELALVKAERDAFREKCEVRCYNGRKPVLCSFSTYAARCLRQRASRMRVLCRMIRCTDAACGGMYDTGASE